MAGKKVVEREFNVFAPVAVAGIGDLPDTVLDRSIIVPMRRRSRHEHIERYRIRVGKEVLGPLRDELAALATRCAPLLVDARPDLPAGIDDRAADCWEPLVAVADLAGGEWPQWARLAAVAVNKLRTERAPSLGEQLLADCHRVFAGLDITKLSIASGDLAVELCRLDDAPWADLRGSMLDARGLARRLRGFDVRPAKIRVGPGDSDTIRGYLRADFADAWDRYLPSLSSAQEPERSEQAEQEEQDPRSEGTPSVADVPVVPDVPVPEGMRETAQTETP
jgi:hypothetical protein